MQNLTKNFTYEEVIKSNTAKKYKIDNNPNEKQLENIQRLLDNLLQPLRDKIGEPIIVNSIFRSKKLNQVLKGAYNSQHLANNGAAADIECPNITNAKLFKEIKDNFDFDQLIWEFGDIKEPNWIHVSYVNKDKNRHQILRAFRDTDGKTKYVNWK